MFIEASDKLKEEIQEINQTFWNIYNAVHRHFQQFYLFLATIVIFCFAFIAYGLTMIFPEKTCKIAEIKNQIFWLLLGSVMISSYSGAMIVKAEGYAVDCLTAYEALDSIDQFVGILG